MELTRTEIKAMRILWGADKPLSRKDLLEMNEDCSWDMSSLHELLNSLIKKGAISEAGFSKCGRRMGRLYIAEYSLEEYLSALIEPVNDILDYKELFKRLNQKSELLR